MVKVGQHQVGWIHLGGFYHNNLKFINDIYIKPEYRGWGVAERVYQYAIDHLNVISIAIQYGRVIANTDYWQKWFKSFISYEQTVGANGQPWGPKMLLSLFTFDCDKPLEMWQDKVIPRPLNFLQLNLFNNQYREKAIDDLRQKGIKLSKNIIKRIDSGAYDSDKINQEIANC